MKYLLILTVGMLLSSCALNTNYSLNKLYYGQSKKEVIRIMNTPSSKRILDKNKEVYIYYLHDSILDLFLTSRFPFVGFYPINRTGKEICLYFENNELIKTIGNGEKL